MHRSTLKLWAAPASADTLLGRTLRCYRLQARIGSGGMGVVYRATHLRLPREVAIKVLRPQLAEDPQLVERFLQEARAVNRIHHPNLVEVIDVDEEPGDPPLVYMVMELLEGVDLARQIRTRGPLDALQAVEIGDAVADALVEVHRQRILHRDLKAENIFLVRRADGGCAVKLLDFGIAASIEAGAARLTSPGALVGTPENMAPEQIDGGALDERTDIYSFGIVLYHMLSGTLPFCSEDISEIFSRQRLTRPPPLARHGGGAVIPAELASVVMRCLEKRPADRYSSIAEVRQAIWTAVGAPGGQPFYSATSRPASGLGEATTWHPAPTPPAPRGGAWSGRMLGVLAGAGVVAALAAWLVAGEQAPDRREPGSPAMLAAPVVRAPAPIAQAIARRAIASPQLPAPPSRAEVRASPSPAPIRPPRRHARPLRSTSTASSASRAAAAARAQTPSRLDRTIDPFALRKPASMRQLASGREP